MDYGVAIWTWPFSAPQPKSANPTPVMGTPAAPRQPTTQTMPAVTVPDDEDEVTQPVAPSLLCANCGASRKFQDRPRHYFGCGCPVRPTRVERVEKTVTVNGTTVSDGYVWRATGEGYLAEERTESRAIAAWKRLVSGDE